MAAKRAATAASGLAAGWPLWAVYIGAPLVLLQDAATDLTAAKSPKFHTSAMRLMSAIGLCADVAEHIQRYKSQHNEG